MTRQIWVDNNGNTYVVKRGVKKYVDPPVHRQKHTYVDNNGRAYIRDNKGNIKYK